MRTFLAMATLMILPPISASAQSPDPADMIVAESSAVIVAADASTITFRPDVLYDVEIANPNEGMSNAAVAPHGVYVAAVPRNEAITMAIKGRGALGFEVAGAAKIDGNAVVLTAGDGRTDAILAARSAYLPGPVETAKQVANLAGSEGQHAVVPSNDDAFISVGGIGSALDLPVDGGNGAQDDAARRQEDNAAGPCTPS